MNGSQRSVSEGNGKFDWQQNLRDLNKAAKLNMDEHDPIWQSISGLRDNQVAINGQVSSLVGAIGDLIGRIPPESLR
jgi:hypothetical protein